jgi:hypothetical protein
VSGNLPELMLGDGTMESNSNYRSPIDIQVKTMTEMYLVRASLPASNASQFQGELLDYDFDFFLDTGTNQSTCSDDLATAFEARGRIVTTTPATNSLFSADCRRMYVLNAITLKLHYNGILPFNNCEIYVTKTGDRNLLTIGTDLMKTWGDVTFNYEVEGVCRMYIPKYEITLIAKTESKLAKQRAETESGEASRTEVRSSVPARLHNIYSDTSESDEESDPETARLINRAKALSLTNKEKYKNTLKEPVVNRAPSDASTVEASEDTIMATISSNSQKDDREPSQARTQMISEINDSVITLLTQMTEQRDVLDGVLNRLILIENKNMEESRRNNFLG